MDKSGQRIKHDSLGSISLVTAPDGPLIRRNTDDANLGLRWFARRVAAREARALQRLDGLQGVPRLLKFDGRTLDRSYLAGTAMDSSRPSELAYYRAARRLLRDLHRHGVAHNDLAKEANWLLRDDGQPGLVDFQMAVLGTRSSRWFRLLCREDLRHLLKHKRSHCPQHLTPVERRLLAQRAWPARLWRATGKRLYILIARRLLGWEDNEGRARRGI